jgi:malic enzyme
MERFELERDDSGEEWVRLPLKGRALLSHNMYNRGTAFTHREREIFDVSGLLPSGFSTIEDQQLRAHEHITRKTDPLEQYIGLQALERRNVTLFYRVLVDNFEELMPIVYTPTVGLGCQMFSHAFRQARGIWITPEDRGCIGEILDHAPWDDVRLIVVTDNERILGLGDQGAGGMGIPCGKISLYIGGAGFHPTKTLPISLDVGTDNEELLSDPLYMGWRHKRVRGVEYDELVEEFVVEVKKKFPDALLQWEDFKKANAFRLLDRYRDRLLCFNDDIQGTAAVAVAGMMAATRITGVPLTEQRIVMVGSGAAGVGITRLLRDMTLNQGATEEEFRRSIALLDSSGLLAEGREITDAFKREFMWSREVAESYGLTAGADLVQVINAVKPNVLVGTSGTPGLFSEDVVRAMAAHVDRPAIFPYSNPNSKSEGVPAEMIRWTEGRALIATGSPFDPVEYEGRTIEIGQGNNVYIFPGVGLGAVVAGARKVTDAMFAAAANALANRVSEGDLAAGRLYPPIEELREISRDIAVAVFKTAIEEGQVEPVDDETIFLRVTEFMWEPKYPHIRLPEHAAEKVPVADPVMP